MRVLVIGAGIVGLATAARLATRGDDVVVIDKEPRLAAHQTGRNSGVIHSGLYYTPGSLKAKLAVAGCASMTAFAENHGVGVRTTGKLVVATEPEEVPRLTELAERGLANGVKLRRITPPEAREYEPHVRCIAALRVEDTGIVDYTGVCAVLADQILAAGGEIRLGTEFLGARTEGSRVRAWIRERPSNPAVPDHDDHRGAAGRNEMTQLTADTLVACGGLHADRIAIACGINPTARIVPFRGEYVELPKEARHLVNGLIYPVPDPRFPFLGVHLTISLDGGVHAGPNAVLALAREGYLRRNFQLAEAFGTMTWPGLWRLASHNMGPAIWEMARSASRTLFSRSLARLVPEIKGVNLRPAPAGVRAQALRRDGKLVDDFLICSAARQIHVINAPSPAATASLEIAKEIERRVDQATSPAGR